jgi:hypothetical protein
MTTNFSVDDCKVLWVVGALERLATLGVLNSDVPLTLTQDAIDDYISIDNDRQYLFESDFEIAQIFRAVANVSNERDVDEDDMCSVIELLLHYKNDREELVKYALSQSFV